MRGDSSHRHAARREFQSRIVREQSVLITAGHAFGDEHLNNIIYQALTIPTFRLVTSRHRIRAARSPNCERCATRAFGLLEATAPPRGRGRTIST